MKTRPQNTVSSARESLRSSSLHARSIAKLLDLKCFCVMANQPPSDLRGQLYCCTYHNDPFSPRFQVAKDLPTILNSLAIEELFHKPDDQGWFTVFCKFVSAGKGNPERHAHHYQRLLPQCQEDSISR